MAAIVNEIPIKAKIDRVLRTQQYVGFARQAAKTRFEVYKDQTLKEFREHTVTKELLQNPNLEGSELVDHGNLVSFIGLEDGSLEVGQMQLFLEENIAMDKTPIINSDKSKVYYNFPVYLPNKQEMDESFPSPWSSRGIISLIEKGIGNAAHYIFRSLGLPDSRSGFGLQIKSERKKGGSFKTMDWISGILDNFKKKFKR
jgi:hypothetical protein